MPLEVLIVLAVVVWLGIAAICASLAVMAARGDRQMRRRPPRRRLAPVGRRRRRVESHWTVTR